MFTFMLNDGYLGVIKFTCTYIASQKVVPWRGSKLIHGSFVIFELKNEDIVKTISFSGQLFHNKHDYLKGSELLENSDQQKEMHYLGNLGMNTMPSDFQLFCLYFPKPPSSYSDLTSATLQNLNLTNSLPI